MDFNNLEERLKRVYSALNERFDFDVSSHVRQEVIRTGNEIALHHSFGAFEEEEIQNRVLGAIEAIAKLKDHLKNRLKERSKDPNLIENLINNSLSLQLVVDIYNEEKHGHPLRRKNRSGLDPQITNLSQGLSVKGPDPGSIEFSINGSGESQLNNVTDNMFIFINGDVIDNQGNLIMSVDNLLNESITQIESFMAANYLITTEHK